MLAALLALDFVLVDSRSRPGGGAPIVSLPFLQSFEVRLGVHLGVVAFFVAMICLAPRIKVQLALALMFVLNQFLIHAEFSLKSFYEQPSPLAVLLAMLGVAPLGFAGFRVDWLGVSGRQLRGGRSQFGLAQLLTSLTFCAVSMACLRGVKMPNAHIQPSLIALTAIVAVGVTICVWVVFSRASWAWKITSLGLALAFFIAAVGGVRFDYFDYMDIAKCFVAWALVMTSLLALARGAGFRGYWLGRASSYANECSSPDSE